eukprot:GHVR01006274.1.p1 GENE.GHVR01006274.1~~GHVR01006274.1.p1  ORF type:complete len:141 (-),score=20.79 GHVR01006274.1:460-882(-)
MKKLSKKIKLRDGSRLGTKNSQQLDANYINHCLNSHKELIHKDVVTVLSSDEERQVEMGSSKLTPGYSIDLTADLSRSSNFTKNSSSNFKLLTWNVDGLWADSEGSSVLLEERTLAVCALVVREAPDIVLLQEVVGRSLV